MENLTRNIPRSVVITPCVNPYALGSAITEFGRTKILITVNLESSVPPFLVGKGKGWLTAEYAMLPGSTHSRVPRERKGISGRSQEIQRLIGRSLRSALDLEALGEKSIMVDCDVLVADGGTRTASITGGYVALALAIDQLLHEKKLVKNPLIHQVAALSVGIAKDGSILADLNYDEDSQCDTDMNVVMTGDNRFVEIQGTAEGRPFSSDQLQAMLSCASKAMQVLFETQKKVLNQFRND